MEIIVENELYDKTVESQKKVTSLGLETKSLPFVYSKNGFNDTIIAFLNPWQDPLGRYCSNSKMDSMILSAIPGF
ncbi:hypothetical protein [Thermoflavimicrobium dichotomicum]|uniref:hypothetical protein n=1 Tax=Thermoflavimicrobium dichotomicum TaxID=46223 RepID=UPI000B8583F3|nr:hypothetical protein [Thermoflavimicrobium dichotomicum]